MLFNFGKCDSTQDMGMKMSFSFTALKEKDLGLTSSADMKGSEQCGIAALKRNQILGLFR